MKKLNITFTTILLVLGCLALSPAVKADPRPTPPPRSLGPLIEGVWAVTRHGVNCQTGQDMGPSFPALITFHQDGTMLAQTYGPFPENAYGPAEMGVWQHGPGNTFSFRDLSYIYDDNGQFNGSGVVTATGQLTSANTFTYTATIQVYDPNGNLLFTACGRAAATRFE
jgi:hypothetical protein